jgi:hypothetical protein
MASKKKASDEIMDAATIEGLRREHQGMILRRMRCLGDSDAAMHQLETETGLPYWSQVNFQHKKDRTPPLKFLLRLEQAVGKVVRRSVENDLAKLRLEAERKPDGDPNLARLEAEAQDILAKLHAKMNRRSLAEKVSE